MLRSSFALVLLGQMFVAGYPGPLAGNPLFTNDGVDLIDRCESRVPHRLCVVAAKVLLELRKVEVGHARDMSGRAHRIDAANAFALDEGDGASRPLEKVRRGESSNPATDYDDVYVEVARQSRVAPS